MKMKRQTRCERSRVKRCCKDCGESAVCEYVGISDLRSVVLADRWETRSTLQHMWGFSAKHVGGQRSASATDFEQPARHASNNAGDQRSVSTTGEKHSARRVGNIDL
eukprot:848698-Rhodomonas_salina.4